MWNELFDRDWRNLHFTCKLVSSMICDVSSGMANSTLLLPIELQKVWRFVVKKIIEW